MLFFGVCGISLSLWMNSHLDERAGFGDLVTAMFVRAVSLTFVFIPISVITLSNLAPEKRGNATGLFNLTRELGGSIGTAGMGLLVERFSKIHGSYLSENVTPYNPLVQEQLGAVRASLGNQTYTTALVPEAVLSMRVRLQALVLSFHDGFLFATGVFLIALVLVFFLKKPQGSEGAAGAH